MMEGDVQKNEGNEWDPAKDPELYLEVELTDFVVKIKPILDGLTDESLMALGKNHPKTAEIKETLRKLALMAGVQ